MCGRLNITDDPFVIEVLTGLGITNPRASMHFGRFKKATDSISIVHEENGQRQLSNATWWLLLDPQPGQGFKPSKYTSFNSRYDKLHVKGSAAYRPFHYSRCIIVVKGFGETQFVQGKPYQYYDFIAADGALCLGGLYKVWHHPDSGQKHYSCSVITLPPHPKLRHYHDKASPLILPPDPAELNAWLDSTQHDGGRFTHLLIPHLYQRLAAVQIDKPSQYHPVSEVTYITKDPPRNKI
ncbi:SOS response-associated peptidase family protein [Pseudoalteromonas sp. OOF1S-7]|uniref:SOS response-associated peptidase family protein n=1 Tax=Pseudoalteromonas sp. OOF1S-7 TaxID=2917757 RepID=UPI001EF56868|nr:SOS response-associated peptidase family protein [Pseudoalteromonas sp. OOF1S-7]MCG7536453.1 SOS response-associated peptidase [Pseudoalteromonas sp. OOF1S-7]